MLLDVCLFHFISFPAEPRLDYTNATVCAFYSAVVDKAIKELGLPAGIPLVFFSHSRGGNNAIRLATSNKYAVSFYIISIGFNFCVKNILVLLFGHLFLYPS